MSTPTVEELIEGKRKTKFGKQYLPSLKKKEKERLDKLYKEYLDEKEKQRKKIEELKLLTPKKPIVTEKMKPVSRWDFFQEYSPSHDSDSDDDLFARPYDYGSKKEHYPFDPLQGGKRKTRKNKRKGTKKNKKNKVKKSKKRIHKKKSLYNRKKK
jgi:hypothetical protein